MPLITDSRDELERYILAIERDEAKMLTKKVIEYKKAMMAVKRKLPKNDTSELYTQIKSIAAQESDPDVKSVLDEIVHKIIQPIKVKPTDAKAGSKRSIFDLLDSGR